MNGRSAGETLSEHGFGFPPTVVFILWYCRHRLLPLHCGRDLVLQRARSQQLHFPLGNSSGSKGKVGMCQLQKSKAAKKHVIELKCNIESQLLTLLLTWCIFIIPAENWSVGHIQKIIC